jgi:hypothetical protein
MGLLLKKGLKIIPQDISSSLAATWRRASREHALNLIKEGNSGKLSRRVPGRKSKPCSSRPSPGARIPETKEALETSPSTSPGNSRGNPECQKLPGCSQCRSPWKPLLQAHSPIVPWASGGKEETADIFRALQFNGCSVRHDFLRTQRQHLPPFTLSPEPIKREQERGKEVFREVYNTIPVMRKA